MIFRLRDFVFYPVPIYQFHRQLTASQSWPPAKLRAWKQEQLERTLTHAVRHVPYYKRTLAPFASQFQDMLDRLDFSELPCITKETIRNHYTELCADNASIYRPVPVHTSGSTGTPTQFLLDRQSNITHFAAIWRVLNWTGYRFGRRFADLTGHVFKHDRLFEYNRRLNCLHLSSFNFRKANIPQYVERLRRFQPFLLKAYPSALDLFCRWLRDLGLTAYRPHAVLTCAESLLDHQKATITETLQCPVFDFYNQNERAALISTCEQGRYHVHEDYAHIDFVPTARHTTGLAAEAEIVTTSLHNFAMPLIRYRTDDLASLGEEAACACGRTYQTIQRIIGRVEDMVVTPDGRHVGRLDAAFKYSPGIRLSQIIQETVDAVRVDIVKADSYTQTDAETLERELRARLGNAIRITLHVVEAIAPGRNGKLQFVISQPGKALLQRFGHHQPRPHGVGEQV